MRRSLPGILILPILFGAFLTSCSGTRPEFYGKARLGFSAVLLAARIITPNGETRDGLMYTNLESEVESYRLKLRPNEVSLFVLEPDKYRLHPTRGLFGGVQRYLKLLIAGRYYRIPFPRSIMRQSQIEVPPAKVVPIGILEARLLPIRRGRARRVELRLDNSIAARRYLIETIIDKQMDPKLRSNLRDSTISWTRALEQALTQVAGEEERKRLYKTPRRP